MEPVPPPAPGPRRPSVLVVDDDLQVRRWLQEAVAGLGYDVEAAADGPEALAAFRRIKHDVVATDMMMPGMTGWELMTALRGIEPTLPIIVLTAYGFGLEREARRHRVTLLHKPVRLPTMEQALRDACAG